MSLTRAEKLDRCRDCRNNFYNQPGNSDTGECWSLADAKSATVRIVGINTPNPDDNTIPLLRLNCWMPNPGFVRWGNKE